MTPSKTGFALLTPAERKAVASKGGKATTARGFSDPSKAREAALKRWRGMLDNSADSEQSK